MPFLVIPALHNDGFQVYSRTRKVCKLIIFLDSAFSRSNNEDYKKQHVKTALNFTIYRNL